MLAKAALRIVSKSSIRVLGLGLTGGVLRSTTVCGMVLSSLMDCVVGC